VTVQVVVVGGGYAGVMAANRLAGRSAGALEVVLVNERREFVERIRLHEHAAGGRGLPTVPFARLLHPAVRLEVGRAVRVDAGGSRLLLVDRELGFDHLVYAAGSTGRRGAGGTGEEHDVATAEAAARAREHVAALPPGAAVLVRGAGHTGIELAAELRGRRPDLAVHLLARGGVGRTLGTRGGEVAEARLRRLGVSVHRSAEPALPPVDLTVRADGLVGASLAADSGLPVDDAARLLVGGDLRVPRYPRVVGAGDGVRVTGRAGAHLRMGCAAALPLGAHAADVVLAAVDGRPPERLDAGFALQCVSLGRGDGIIQVVRPDDTARAVRLHGRPAAAVKELVCRQTLRWLAAEARRPGSFRWPAGPRDLARR
jgi:NADH dehydrogenase FAD-containing subunit